MLASIFGLFTSCIQGLRQEPDKQVFLDPEVDPSYRVPRCVFCDVSTEKGFNVVWEVRQVRCVSVCFG